MSLFESLFGRRGNKADAPSTEELMSEVSREIRDLLGNEGKAKDEGSKVLNFSDLMSQRLGAELLGRLTTEVELEVLQSRVVADNKAAVVERAKHCLMHNEREEGLRARVAELEGELETTRGRLSATDRRAGQFRSTVVHFQVLVSMLPPGIQTAC